MVLKKLLLDVMNNIILYYSLVFFLIIISILLGIHIKKYNAKVKINGWRNPNPNAPEVDRFLVCSRGYEKNSS